LKIKHNESKQNDLKILKKINFKQKKFKFLQNLVSTTSRMSGKRNSVLGSSTNKFVTDY
jgi:hypothetical protein